MRRLVRHLSKTRRKIRNRRRRRFLVGFPFHKDFLFGTDHNDKVPFDHKDKSIEFVCANLNHHGFGFLLNEDLDEMQLDVFMIASWSILQSIHEKTDQFPNQDRVGLLSIHNTLRQCLLLC
jgi:hypothetical protein